MTQSRRTPDTCTRSPRGNTYGTMWQHGADVTSHEPCVHARTHVVLCTFVTGVGCVHCRVRTAESRDRLRSLPAPPSLHSCAHLSTLSFRGRCVSGKRPHGTFGIRFLSTRWSQVSTAPPSSCRVAPLTLWPWKDAVVGSRLGHHR